MSTNPIIDFGIKAADVILAEVDTVDQPHRKLALKATLDTIDPTLWQTTERTASKFRNNHEPREALKRALAASLADGFIRDIHQAGTVCKTALSGMAECVTSPFTTICCQQPFVKARFNQTWAGLDGYEGLSTIRAGETLDLGSDMVRAGETLDLGNDMVRAGETLDLGGFWNDVGSAIASGASTAYHAARNAVSTVGKLACKALNTSQADLVAGVGASLIGGTAQMGIAGANILQNQCNYGSQQVQQQVQQQQAQPNYTLWVAGGAGALVILALALR